MVFYITASNVKLNRSWQ